MRPIDPAVLAEDVVRLADAVLADEPRQQEWRSARSSSGLLWARPAGTDPVVDLDWVQPLDPILAAVDRHVRRIAPGTHHAWDRAAARHWPLIGEAPCWPVVRALSMHPNGTVREAAVARMAEDRQGHFPWLAVRATDWVPVVRERAEATAVSLLETVPLPALISWDRLVLSARSRRLAPALVGAYEKRLLDDPRRTIAALGAYSHLAAAVVLASEAVGPSVLVGTPCAYRGITEEGLRRADIKQIEAHLRQHELRGGLPLSLLAAHAWPEVDSAAVLGRRERRRLFGDPTMARFHELVVDGVLAPTRAAEKVVAALLGDTAERRLAQRLCAAAGLDVAGYYRRLLRLAPTAIVGLGEVGEASDAAAVRPYLDAEDEIRRSAAVSALRLDPDAYLEELVGRLGDPSARVARTAALRLRRRVGSVGPERIFDLALAGNGPHSRSVCTDLLRQLPADELVPLLVRRLSSTRAERELALAELRAWRGDLERRGRAASRRSTPSPAVMTEATVGVEDDHEASSLLDLSTPLQSTPPPPTERREAWGG